jgi:hypothetical protein
MQPTSDRERALTLIGLDQSWSDLKYGKTVKDQVFVLLGGLPRAHLTAIETAIMVLAEQVEADGQQRSEQGCELDYHNRDHVRDVLVALNLLVEACPNILSTEDLHLTVLAMVGHDLGHDGLPNRTPQELEIQSWEMVRDLLEPLRLPRQALRRVRSTILLTDPKDYPRLAKRCRNSALSIQIGLAVDSDLFASLLPSRGFLLGARLADEQVRAGLPQAKALATLQGRSGFLKYVPLLSDAIRSLGMQGLIDAQLSVINQLDEGERLRPWTPDWGDEFAGLVHDHLRADKSN